MSYLPPHEIADDMIAFCHMVKSQDSLQAGRAAASFLAQVFDCDGVAIFRMNSAGTELVLCEAVAIGDSHYAPQEVRVPLTHKNSTMVNPILHSVFSGQNLKLSAPFVGFDIAGLSQALKLSNLQTLESLRLMDRRGKLVGVALLFYHSSENKPRFAPSVLELISEVIGMVLGGYTELAEAEERLENMNEIYALETAARQDLQARVATQMSNIIGDSEPVRRLRRDISHSAKGRNSVMLIGEEGVGRRAVAREIHSLSNRSNGPFRVLDMKRISDANLHPELLGYKRGAISGVASARRGVLADASGGTLYLKNFDAASLNAQEFLDHVMQTGKIRTLGSEMDREVDIRFIASVSKEYYLDWQRRDVLPSLFHRLAVNVIEVPSLAEIREDLRAILNIEIERLNRAHHRDVVMSEDAILFLTQRDYTGNLAELRSLIERLHLNANDDENITAQHIQELLNPISQTCESSGGQDMGLKDQLREYERVLILNALNDAGGSRALAAEKLKLPKRTLAEKCKNFGL